MMRPLSFRTHLLLFAGAFLLPLGGLLVWQARAEFQGNLASARQASLNLAQLAAAHYSQFLIDSERTLQRLAQRPRVRALDPARCDPVLRDLHELQPLFTNVAVMQSDGTLICPTLPPPDGRSVSLAAMPWFEQMRDAPGIHVTEPFRGQFTERPVIVLSTPVRDGNGAIAGRVGMSVDLLRFQGMMGSLSLSSGSVLALLSPEGALLARLPPMPERIGVRLNKTGIVERALAMEEGTADEVGFDGVRRLYGFTRVRQTGWPALAGIPKEQVQASAAHAREAAVTYLAAVLLLLLFIAALYRWMARAVQVLSSAIAAAKRGDASGLTPAAGPVELRDTVAAFNSMLAARLQGEEALRLSNERYELVSRATNDAVWDWDLTSDTLLWGRGFQVLFGYAPEELEPGIESWNRRLHPDDLARVTDGIYKVIEGDGSLWSDEYRFRRADGSYAHVFDRGSVIRDAAGKAVRMVGAMIDITERKTQQAKIVRLSRAHAVLSGINALIVRAHSRTELLQDACRIAVEQGLFPAAWIGLREGDEIQPVALYGERGREVKDELIRLSAGELQGGGPVALALRAGKPSMSNDVLKDPALAPWHGTFRALGYNSYVVYPLCVAGKVMGCLFLYGRESNLFDEAELKLLSQLASDISYAMEYITKEEALGNLALYDPLTRLPNRTLFIQRLDPFLLSARDHRKPLAVLMLDVDRFKYINDLVDRAGGDELLKKIAERLKRITGGSDHMARIGGDRFAVAIPDSGEASNPAALLKGGHWDLLDLPYPIGEQELKITFKFGMALFPEDGGEAEMLLRNAEAALKHARSSGQRHMRYTRQMSAAVAEKLKLEAQMGHALERNEFVLHYQPKVDLKTGALCGAEALIRWNSPERGLVPPLEFISLIEETGQILDVGRWVLQQAASDYRAWIGAGLRAPRLSVNVSQAQLLQPDFVHIVKDALAEQGCSVADIELEITESMLMTDSMASTGKLRALRELGASIVMDDFGTGYSSLSALAQLPLTAIKIDRSFVAGMVENSNTMTIVSTIVTMAHSLNLKVVAEGVEAPEQLKFLRMLRCDELQGFFFSKALPADEFVQLLKQGRRLQAAEAQGDPPDSQ